MSDRWWERIPGRLDPIDVDSLRLEASRLAARLSEVEAAHRLDADASCRLEELRVKCGLPDGTPEEIAGNIGTIIDLQREKLAEVEAERDNAEREQAHLHERRMALLSELEAARNESRVFEEQAIENWRMVQDREARAQRLEKALAELCASADSVVSAFNLNSYKEGATFTKALYPHVASLRDQRLSALALSSPSEQEEAR